MNTQMRLDFSRWPMTWVLLGVMAVLWLMMAVDSGSIMSTANSTLGDLTLLYAPDVAAGGWNYLRLVSSILVHLSLPHLLLNGFMLYFLAGIIESATRSWELLVIFLLCGLGGSLAVLYFDPLSPTGGASGALFGMMAIYIALSFKQDANLSTPLALLGANLAYTFITTGVSVSGHLGGLAMGMVLMPFFLSKKPAPRVIGYALGAGLVVVFVLLWLR